MEHAGSPSARASTHPVSYERCTRGSVRPGKSYLGGALGTLYQVVPLVNDGNRTCVVPSATAVYLDANGRGINLPARSGGELGGPAYVSPREPARVIVGVGEPDDYAPGDCEAREATRLRIRLVGIGTYVIAANELVCSRHSARPALRLYGSNGTGDREN